MAFTNRDRLRRRLKAIPAKVRKALREQNATNAAELAETMKGFAPEDQGALIASIKHQDVSTSTRISQEVRAGGAATTRPVRNSEKGAPDYDYALAQEFGTEDMPATPFFWPAYRLKKRRFRQRMNRAAKKAVKEATGV